MKHESERTRELVYPRIDEAIKANGGATAFVRSSGLGLTTYYHMQDGTSQPTKYVIDRILEFTGLTYEEAFK